MAMKDKVRTAFVIVVWLMAFLGGGVLAAGQKKAPETKPQVSPHERGVAHFERGFYEFLPRGRAAEAAGEFDLAVREFKQALELDPTRAQTHRALARVYRVQERYLLAAEHYQKVTELTPHDIDAYVFAADALAEAGRLEDAGNMLQRAKTMTADPGALKSLDGLLEKLAGDGREPDKIS
jgi:tetratricopeptide (TPR) repeat protein